ncbi:hypothetical protein diail_2670 [Diaporthe ilicicola]|nr:hypothetical protein diail_2670 [Diaporthe ilicicola]
MEAAAGAVLSTAHELYTRANETSTDTSKDERPPVYKVIGICLAIGSGLFIGTSFVLKKVGLLKANEKYQEEAGEGYGYLKNAFWWSGMTLMILGEVLNFVAYAFTDAILVTPMGALSVVITSVLSAIFLKERLSMVGKVACFLCIVGSVVIVMNAPEESSVADIQEMQKFVIAPGFLSYAGVIIIGSAIVAYFVGPKYGKKNMMKALNLFNAAMVTPTYYVYFTSTTIITSAVLFQGFKGTASSIVTVVMGFLTICSGVVLLQLSKSAKDVPDAAVFSGDLNQVRTIAEQEQAETEPKADAIRGAAALVRRFSTTREKMEMEEYKRMRAEKEQERLEAVSEDGQPQFEWDGLRRRRTTLGSQHRHPDFRQSSLGSDSSNALNISTNKIQSPMHPVQLTEISVAHGGAYGVPAGAKTEYDPGSHGSSDSIGGPGRHIHFGGETRHTPDNVSLAPPTPPPHAQQHSAKRQFSFQNVFKRSRDHGNDGAEDRPTSSKSAARPISSRGYSAPHAKTATEEERLGLVKGDSNDRGPGYSSTPALPLYEEDDYEGTDDYPYDDDALYGDDKMTRYGRGITDSPPRGRSGSGDSNEKGDEHQRSRWNEGRSGSRDQTPPTPPPKPPAHGGGSGSGSGSGTRTPRGGAYI